MGGEPAVLAVLCRRRWLGVGPFAGGAIKGPLEWIVLPDLRPHDAPRSLFLSPLDWGGGWLVRGWFARVVGAGRPAQLVSFRAVVRAGDGRLQVSPLREGVTLGAEREALSNPPPAMEDHLHGPVAWGSGGTPSGPPLLSLERWARDYLPDPVRFWAASHGVAAGVSDGDELVVRSGEGSADPVRMRLPGPRRVLAARSGPEGGVLLCAAQASIEWWDTTGAAGQPPRFCVGQDLEGEVHAALVLPPRPGVLDASGFPRLLVATAEGLHTLDPVDPQTVDNEWKRAAVTDNADPKVWAARAVDQLLCASGAAQAGFAELAAELQLGFDRGDALAVELSRRLVQAARAGRSEEAAALRALGPALYEVLPLDFRYRMDAVWPEQASGTEIETGRARCLTEVWQDASADLVRRRSAANRLLTDPWQLRPPPITGLDAVVGLAPWPEGTEGGLLVLRRDGLDRLHGPELVRELPSPAADASALASEPHPLRFDRLFELESAGLRCVVLVAGSRAVIVREGEQREPEVIQGPGTLVGVGPRPRVGEEPGLLLAWSGPRGSMLEELALSGGTIRQVATSTLGSIPITAFTARTSAAEVLLAWAEEDAEDVIVHQGPGVRAALDAPTRRLPTPGVVTSICVSEPESAGTRSRPLLVAGTEGGFVHTWEIPELRSRWSYRARRNVGALHAWPVGGDGVLVLAPPRDIVWLDSDGQRVARHRAQPRITALGVRRRGAATPASFAYATSTGILVHLECVEEELRNRARTWAAGQPDGADPTAAVAVADGQGVRALAQFEGRDARRVYVRSLKPRTPVELRGLGERLSGATWRDLVGAAQLVGDLDGAEDADRWEELLALMTRLPAPEEQHGDNGLGASGAAFAELLRCPQARALDVDRLCGVAASMPRDILADSWVQLEWCRRWYGAIGGGALGAGRVAAILSSLDQVPTAMAPMLGPAAPSPELGRAVAALARLLPVGPGHGLSAEQEFERLVARAHDEVGSVAGALEGPAPRALRHLLSLATRDAEGDPRGRSASVMGLIEASRMIPPHRTGPIESMLRAAGLCVPPGPADLSLPIPDQVRWLLRALQRPLDAVPLGEDTHSEWGSLAQRILTLAAKGWREGLVQRLTWVSGLSRLFPEDVRGDPDAVGRMRVSLRMRREGEQVLRDVHLRLQLVDARTGTALPRATAVERDWALVDEAFPPVPLELVAESALPPEAWAIAVQLTVGSDSPLFWQQPVRVTTAEREGANAPLFDEHSAVWGHLRRELGALREGVVVLVVPTDADVRLLVRQLSKEPENAAAKAPGTVVVDVDLAARDLGPGGRFPDALTAEALYRILAGMPPRGVEAVHVDTAEELVRPGVARIVLAPMSLTGRRLLGARREAAEEVGRFLAAHSRKARGPAIILVADEEIAGDWWALIPAPVRMLWLGELRGDEARRALLAAARAAGLEEREAHQVWRACAGDVAVGLAALRAGEARELPKVEERLRARALRALRSAPPAARLGLLLQAAQLERAPGPPRGDATRGRLGAVTREARSWGRAHLEGIEALGGSGSRRWLDERSTPGRPTEPFSGALQAIAVRPEERASEWVARAVRSLLDPTEFWGAVHIPGLRSLPVELFAAIPGGAPRALPALRQVGLFWHDLERGQPPDTKRATSALTALVGKEVEVGPAPNREPRTLRAYTVREEGQSVARLWPCPKGRAPTLPPAPAKGAQVLVDPFDALVETPPGYVHLRDAELRTLLGTPEPGTVFWALVNRRGGLAARSPYRRTDALEAESRMFVGRRAELEMFDAHAADRNFLILGPRRIGKTSLLEQLVARARTRGMATLRVEGQGVSDPETLRLALEQAWRTEQALAVETSASATAAGASHDAPSRPGPLGALDAFLEQARQAGTPAVLFMNEVDGLLAARPGYPSGREDLLAVLRARLEDPRNHLRVVFVGYAQCQRLLGDPQSTLHRLFIGLGGTVWNLSAFSDAEALELLATLTGPPLHLAWRSREDRTQGERLLMRRTYRIPWLLQASCHRLLEALDRLGRAVLEYADVATVFSERHDLLDYLLGLDLKEFLPGPEPEVARGALAWYLLLTAVSHTHLTPPPDNIEGLLAEDPEYRSFTADECGEIAVRWATSRGELQFATRLSNLLPRYDLTRFLDGVCITPMLGRRQDAGSAARYFFQNHLLPVELLFADRARSRLIATNLLHHQRELERTPWKAP